jgi:hypothetical protein
MDGIISRIVSMIAGVFVRRGVRSVMDRTMGGSRPGRGEGGGGREAEKSARRAARQARKATRMAGKL